MEEINNENEGLINVLFEEKNYASGILFCRLNYILINNELISAPSRPILIWLKSFFLIPY